MNRRIPDWNRRRVWLIGPVNGTGRACADLLRGLGASVALSSPDEPALHAAVDGTRRTLALPVDMGDHASIAAAFEHIVATWGGVDLMVMFGEAGPVVHARDFDLDAASAMIECNLQGVYRCLDAVLPCLLAQGGGAIGIVAAQRPFAGGLVQGPVAAALDSLAEALYLELRPLGINVYQINSPPDGSSSAAQDTARRLVEALEKGCFRVKLPGSGASLIHLVRLLPPRMFAWLCDRLARP